MTGKKRRTVPASGCPYKTYTYRNLKDIRLAKVVFFRPEKKREEEVEDPGNLNQNTVTGGPETYGSLIAGEDTIVIPDGQEEQGSRSGRQAPAQVDGEDGHAEGTSAVSPSQVGAGNDHVSENLVVQDSSHVSGVADAPPVSPNHLALVPVSSLQSGERATRRNRRFLPHRFCPVEECAEVLPTRRCSSRKSGGTKRLKNATAGETLPISP